jgi:hypothetical protein
VRSVCFVPIAKITERRIEKLLDILAEQERRFGSSPSLLVNPPSKWRPGNESSRFLQPCAEEPGGAGKMVVNVTHDGGQWRIQTIAAGTPAGGERLVGQPVEDFLGGAMKF